MEPVELGRRSVPLAGAATICPDCDTALPPKGPTVGGGLNVMEGKRLWPSAGLNVVEGERIWLFG